MITPGTILIAMDAPRPDCFEIEGDSNPTGWMPVGQKLTPPELERELSTAGWTFFYIAISIRKIAFGFDRAKMFNAALKRVIGNVRQEGCNCVQIDEVAVHSFLRMPYVSISGHPRHIQKGMVFFGKQ